MIVLLKGINKVAARFGFVSIARCGDYGDPPQLPIWSTQVVVYFVVLTLMKVHNVLVIEAFFTDLASFSTTLFSAFENYRHLELTIVMLVVPGCCNAAQFWILDSCLKIENNQLHLSRRGASAHDNEKHCKGPASFSQPPLCKDEEAVTRIVPVESFVVSCQSTDWSLVKLELV